MQFCACIYYILNLAGPAQVYVNEIWQAGLFNNTLSAEFGFNR